MMRLIKSEVDLIAYENEVQISDCDYKDGRDNLPNYPYLLEITFGGESWNGPTSYNYTFCSVDDAWNLLIADAEIKACQ